MMLDASPPEAEDPEARFAREAAATGLVVPRRRSFDAWSAVAIAVAVIVILAGIGTLTGWLNVRSSPSPGFQYPTCSGYPVELAGAVTSDLDPGYASWLMNSGSELSQSVGGCVRLSVATPSSDEVPTVLSDPAVKFVATYVGPGATAGVVAGANYTVVPVALAAVAIIYDLPGISQPLNLTGPALAGLFNGSITSWDDPAIAASNPGVDLAGLPAVEVRFHANSSATNSVFTEFLAAESPSWSATIGSGATVAWPVGTGVGSDAQMVMAVASTPGAIGYIDLLGLPPSGVGIAQVEDAAGQFEAPGAISAWLAAESFANSSAVHQDEWTSVSLLGASDAGSYPISMLAYIGLYRDLGTPYGGAFSLANATWVLEYIYWLTGGSALAPLPSGFGAAAVSEIENETYDGTPIVPSENETGEGGGETGEF